MKKFFGFFLALIACSLQALAAFKGSTPESGKSYYLYNLYQSKFLAAGNDWGTKASLNSAAPLLCSLTTSGEGFTINTHFNGNDVYLGVVDGNAWVDRPLTDGNRVVWTFAQQTEGYTISSDGASLMFDSGTACTMGNTTEGFNQDKALWLLVDEDAYAAYQAKKRFTFASLNVDGMPRSIRIAGVYNYELNPDAKESDGAWAIGNKVKDMGWDVIALSEDFNFHDDLMNGLSGSPYQSATHRGKIATSASTYMRFIAQRSPLFDIDGLGLLYNNAKATQSGESWTAWNTHNGYTSDGADGLIDKGFRYYLITLQDGTQVDLYIHHMDAESSAADNAARESQLTQLVNHIKGTNNQRPIIVMGDTNCRYTRDRLKSLFVDALNADERFTVQDPWIIYGRHGIYPTYGAGSIMASSEGYRKGEVVDKIFLINNKESNIRLVAESYAQDQSFINEQGEPLADHWPCVVEFSYHTYDPAVDEVVSDVQLSGKAYYLKNAETGLFLKSGGWWGTHAMQGVYGMPIELVEMPNGAYVLQTPIGSVCHGDVYMDNGDNMRWNILQGTDGYVFSYDNRALTANDPAYVSYGPNRRYVTTADLNINDRHQQWQLVSTDGLLSDARFVSQESPINLTHLLGGANFDAKDNAGIAKWEGWPEGATVMWYNKGDGKLDDERGNNVAEVFVNSYSGTTTYGTTWDIHQTINVPNGHYRITCQAFMREGSVDGGRNNAYLYANGVQAQLPAMKEATCTEAIGSVQSNGYYYPNNMSEASQFFNRGYYQVGLDVDVTDGQLTVGIAKQWATKGTAIWTCFDNFQIEYWPETTLLRGDMNQDGRFTLSDLTLMINAQRGEGGDKGVADMDGNHLNNSADVDLLRSKLLE